MILLIPVVIALGVAVGLLFGWKWVLAPLLGWLIWTWASTMLRSMAQDARAGGTVDGEGAGASPEPVGPDERTLFWCHECGTELLLLVRGDAAAPKHCGLEMHERTEILS